MRLVLRGSTNFHSYDPFSCTIYGAIQYCYSFCYSTIALSVSTNESNSTLFSSIEVPQLQPVSYKRYFRCNNCFLLLVYTIHLSLSTELVDPPPMGTFYMKHALFELLALKNKKTFIFLFYSFQFEPLK